MINRLKILHKGLLLVGAPFLLGLAIVISLAAVLQEMDKARAEESKLRTVSLALADMTSEGSDAAWSVFATIHPRMRAMGLSDPQKKMEKAKVATDLVVTVSKGTGELEEALKEPIAYQYSLNEQLEKIAKLAPENAAEDPGSLLALLPLVARAQDTVAASTESDLKLLDLSERLVQKSENRLAEIRRAEASVLALAFVANAALAAALLFFFRKAILERLQAIGKKVGLLSSDTPLGEPAAGTDEIARLDAAFCTMDKSLREAARQETALFNNASDLIFVLDESFKFSKVNAASKVILGTQQKELLGTTLFAWIHIDDHHNLIQSLKQCCSGEPGTSFECRITKQDGSQLETAWSVFWEACEGSWFCVVHDISAYKNLERLKAQYFSFVSGHLAGPLQKIADLLDRLVSDSQKLPEKAAERVATLQNNLARLVKLSAELLQTQVYNTSEKPELSYETLEMHELLKAAAAELEALAGRRQIVIKTEGAASFEGDRGRLMQVLVNLLSNSVKYSPDGGAVKLSCSETNGCVHVSIKDQGRGVPAEFRETIFEKFKQVTAADGKRQAGTGLGLPICKQLIEWHGGKIGVNSQEGQGSDFWFEIPLQQSPLAQADLLQSQADPLDNEFLNSRSAGGSPASTALARSTLTLKQVSAPGSKDLKLMQQGYLLIGIPLLFELIFIAALSLVFLQSQAETEADKRERNLSYAATKLWFHYRQLSILQVRDGAEDNIRPGQLLKQMKQLAAGSPARLKVIEKIKASCRGVEHAMAQSPKKRPELRGLGSMLSGPDGLKALPAQLNSLRGLLKVSTLARQIQELLKDSSKRQALVPQKQAQIRNIQTVLLFIGLAFNVLVSVALAIYFSKQITSRLIHLSDNCQRLAAEKPLQSPIGGDDEIAHLEQAFHTAASSLIEAREKERSVLFKSKEVICSLDEDGKFTKLNPAAIQMWQYEPEELRERKLLDLISAKEQDHVKTQLSNPETTRTFESEVTRKDGSTCYVLWSISRPEGERSTFCVAHDISAKKEMEKITNEFLHMIGHDLRTPLSSVMMNTKVMEVGVLGEIPPESLPILSDVTKQCNNLLELINDLLDLEKLNAGMMQLNLSTTELEDMLEHLRVATFAHAEDRQVTLSIAAGTGKLSCDADRLSQALINLLLFLIKQTNTGGAVTVSSNIQDNNLTIKIENNSPSIAQAHELFDRFKVFQRTGSLALPIAKQIIESHGGTLSIESSYCSNTLVAKIPIRQPAMAAL